MEYKVGDIVWVGEGEGGHMSPIEWLSTAIQSGADDICADLICS